ncbi:Putative flippase GtrA (transmembrane translocase of bactoprenol-linked glucose) [Prosthecobacter debontii]|uniref:Putative flippase GtrA (Transmembrane translocase of bactoprenol-linked glucose) n=1 Tax=Prosthecobacter debontii TaxID=48467 RepID=A0A1T4XT62_9BACT|nr:GtrA family protein [Prosthecobacter debontii]SKA92727.1 Putative flippase GtrA (transmembrane translocase of bactoprenol-linked glucose) [Prosthecobacter debontii]
MISHFSSAAHFVRNNDWRTILAHVNSRDAHPLLQFIKYGICGVGAFATHQIIWVILSVTLFPSIDPSLSNETRALNSTISNSIAVFFSTAVAYITNVLWVFKSGRHNRLIEIASFFGIGIISFGGGLLAGPWLIKVFGLNTLVAQLSMAVTSVLINFVCRKFFIFKH